MILTGYGKYEPNEEIQSVISEEAHLSERNRSNIPFVTRISVGGRALLSQIYDPPISKLFLYYPDAFQAISNSLHILNLVPLKLKL